MADLPGGKEAGARSRSTSALRRVTRAAVMAYAALLATLTLLPLRLVDREKCEDQLRTWKLDLVGAMHDVTEAFAEHGARAIFDGSVVDFFLNVLLFAPIGFAITWVWRRSWWLAAVVGLGVSVLVEVLQGTAVFGLFACPWRQADISDIVSNTLGAVLGAIAGRALGRSSESRSQRS